MNNEGNDFDDIAADFAADIVPFKVEEAVEEYTQNLEEEIKLTFATTKVTKEDLIFTPVPIFDCIYCVRGKQDKRLNQTTEQTVHNTLIKMN